MKLDIDEMSLGELTNYMFPPSCPIKADATIVLGQTLWERPLQKAVELYQSGLSGALIFTGGFNPKLDTTEANCMADGWLQMGYPRANLLIDQNAKNTMENMMNSKALLELNGLLDQTLKINLVTISFHMRRALETFHYVFAGKTYELGVVSYPSIYCDPLTWHLNEQGRMLVMTEFKKINQYLRKPTQ